MAAVTALAVIAATEPRRLFAPIRIDSEEEIATCVPEDLA